MNRDELIAEANALRSRAEGDADGWRRIHAQLAAFSDEVSKRVAVAEELLAACNALISKVRGEFEGDEQIDPADWWKT